MNYRKVIVALDGMSSLEAIRYAKILKNSVWGFKVNDLLFHDSKIISKLKKYGKVFADAKLYDIPNTVSNSVKKLSSAGADIITIHASGGLEMMKAAKLNSGKSKIIAVTVLTSKNLKHKNEVANLVQDSILANVDGIVCSGHELKAISKLKGSNKMIKVVPGIRPKSYRPNDDQNRVIEAKDAFRFGADLIVVGRPITQFRNSKDILKALGNI